MKSFVIEMFFLTCLLCAFSFTFGYGYGKYVQSQVRHTFAESVCIQNQNYLIENPKLQVYAR